MASHSGSLLDIAGNLLREFFGMVLEAVCVRHCLYCFAVPRKLLLMKTKRWIYVYAHPILILHN